MKKIYLTALLAVMSALTACGEKVGRDVDTPREIQTEAARTSVQTQTTAAPTEATVAATEVKKEISKDIPDEVFFETIDAIEVYEEVTAAELIVNTNVELIEPEKMISTDKLGECSVSISLTMRTFCTKRKLRIMWRTQLNRLSLIWVGVHMLSLTSRST